MCEVAEIVASVQQLLHVQNSDQEALEQNLTSWPVKSLDYLDKHIDVNNKGVGREAFGPLSQH